MITTTQNSKNDDFATLREYIIQFKGINESSVIRKKVLESLDCKSTKAKLDVVQPSPSVGVKPSSLQPSKPTLSDKPSSISACRTRRTGSVVLTLFRFVFIESPLALLFATFILFYHLEYAFDQYLVPIMDAARWTDSNRLQNEFTYYDRRCDKTDITTTSLEDLILPIDSNAQKAVDTMMTHGTFILPDLLSEEVSTALRSHILKRNEGLTYEEDIPLDTPENRWSFGIGANENPAVTAALKELSSNALLTQSLEKLLGPNPAVAEITTITSAYGAKAQGWHPDVKPEGNSVKYGRTFTHSYSLFIPLQNVTAEMGATEICPGTHYCGDEELDACYEMGFQAANEDRIWKVGDALLMNQCMWHRGQKFTDPNAPNRVVFILSFISRPRPGLDHRQLSHGTYFHIKPDMYGHTLKDLRSADTTMTLPFSALRSLGLWKPAGTQWGWDWLTTSSLRISNSENGYHIDDLFEFHAYHSIAKAIPSFLRTEPTEEGGWQQYVRDMLKRLKWFLGFAYFFSALTCIIAIALIQQVARTGHRHTRSVIYNMILSSGTILLLLSTWMTDLSETEWGQSVSSRNIFSRPLQTTIKSMPRSQYLTTVPEKKDVLLGTRYDSKYIGYYRHFLDYHPGNVVWINHLDAVSAYFHSYEDLPSIFQDKALEKISTEMQEEVGRVLTQNESGEWFQIKDEEFQKRLLEGLYERKSFLYSSLREELKFLKDDALYGSIPRIGVMYKETVRGLWIWKNSFELNVGLSQKSQIHDHDNPKSNLESTFPATFSIPTYPVRDTNSFVARENLLASSAVERISIRSQFKVGDKVFVIDQSTNGLIPATLLAVSSRFCQVQMVDGTRRSIKAQDIRHYEPFTQGDKVFLKVRDCEECEVYVSKGTIAKAYPDYTYDVKVGRRKRIQPKVAYNLILKQNSL